MSDKTVTEQVDELEVDRDELAALVDELRQDCNQLQKERDEAWAERDRLRAGQDRWGDDFPCCSYGAAPTGYAPDDHQDAEITQWHDETRLTVHDLNVAPVGSYVIGDTQVAQKLSDGRWGLPRFAGSRTPEELIRFGWSTARLETGGSDA